MTSAATPTLRQDAQVIGLVGISHGISHFYHLILAPLFPWLGEAFHLSNVQLGLLMTVFFIMSGTGQAAAGFVVDRVGARAVLFAGMALLGVSALVLSSAQNYFMLLAGSLLAGAGNSVFHPADFTILNKRVSNSHLAHAYSVHGISGNLGWAAAPIFLTSIAGIAGWRTALLAAAFVPLAWLLVLLAHREVVHTDAHNVVAAAKADLGGSAIGFMRLPSVWMCFAFFFITAMALGGIQSFSVPGLRDIYGMSLASATTGYTGYMLASAAGMVWGGFLASRAARHERTIAMAFVVSAATAMLLAAGIVPAWTAVMLMGVIGIGAGVAGPSRDLLIRAAAPKNATGRVYGVVYSGLDIGLAGAPVLFGAIMDAHHPTWVFAAIGAFQMLAIMTAVGVGTNTAKRVAEARIA